VVLKEIVLEPAGQLRLDATVLDRAAGAVIGGAVGDALGAGYEFGLMVAPEDVEMLIGRLTGEPAGCWTDDTAMAIAILETAASMGTLITTEASGSVGNRFIEWYRTHPRDVGNQIRAVLERASSGSDLESAAAVVQEMDPSRAGNGSLMRTGPVALAHLGNDDELVEAAKKMSALTHLNPYALDACVLWTIAIDRAVRTGELIGPRAGLHLIDKPRRAEWEVWITDAETRSPREFNPNGYVVNAFQAAWSAIYTTRFSSEHYVAAVREAVAIGNDTDTVAAIAGSLVGATYGLRSIPVGWQNGLRGWPRAYQLVDLIRLSERTVASAPERKQ
jgi:ADP-ribosylglycohydrolase